MTRLLAAPFLLLALDAPSALASPLEPNWLDGEWTGVYYCAPAATRLYLDLSASGGTVEGTMRFESTTSGPTSVGQGTYRVRGAFNPATRSLVLTPGEWVERPRSGLVLPVGLDGVADVRTSRIAGAVTTTSARNLACSDFVAARDRRGEALIEDALEGGVVSAPGMTLVNRCDDDVRRWLSRVPQEYPDVNPRGYYGETDLTLNLFDDAHFESFFGATFDELGARRRGRISMEIRNCRRQDPTFFQSFAHLDWLATGDGRQGQEIAIAVMARRSVRSWAAALREELDDFNPSLASLGPMRAIGDAAATQLARLWPSERRAFGNVHAARLADVAGPALAGSLDSLLTAAVDIDGAEDLAQWPTRNEQALVLIDNERRARFNEQIRSRIDILLPEIAERDVSAANGYDGAVALATWMETNSVVAAAASPDVRNRVRALLESESDRLLAQAVVAESRALDSLGEGYEAATRGSDWYRGFVVRYSFAAGKPEVANLISKLQQRRPRDLELAEGAVLARMFEAQTAAQVAVAESQVLAVPGDDRTVAGTRIAEFADWRRRFLGMEQVLGRKVTAEELTVCQLSEANRPPCVLEIYAAVQGYFGGRNSTLQAFNAYCSDGKFKDRSNLAAEIANSIGAIGCLYNAMGTFGQFDMRVELRRLEILGCTPSEQSRGYNCTLRIALNADSQLLRAGVQQRNPIYVFANALMQSGGTGQWYFEHSNGDWQYATQPRP